MKLDINELEDIEDILAEIESSFNIKFEDDELINLKTLGNLFDLIRKKIKLIQVNDCTKQQAFYKLRYTIETELGIDRKHINPNTSLENIFPSKGRKQKSKKIEKKLGFKLKLVRPPLIVSILLIFLLLASFIGLFIIWQYGLVGIGISIFGFWIADKLGKELDLNTVGEVAEKMTRKNYIKSRRHPETFNGEEVEKIVSDWISDALDKPDISREIKLS